MEHRQGKIRPLFLDPVHGSRAAGGVCIAGQGQQEAIGSTHRIGCRCQLSVQVGGILFINTSYGYSGKMVRRNQINMPFYHKSSLLKGLKKVFIFLMMLV